MIYEYPPIGITPEPSDVPKNNVLEEYIKGLIWTTYYYYDKCKDNKWYCINDSSASVVKSENMTDGFPHELNNAYIVKYSNFFIIK